jgi:hypothetical protein
MCGIVGVISSAALTYQNTNIFKHMLQMDVVRGKDSVGMISLTGTEITCAKSVTSPTDFLDHRRVQPILAGAVKALVGHNRHATKGKVSANNAHPFEHGPVSLVHNGTLTFPMPPDSTLFDTDSECIAYNLSRIQPEEAGGFISTLNGAFTLVWFDTRDSSWNMIRNEERPLKLMQNTAGTVLYLSSETGIMYAATTKEGMAVEPATHIFDLPVGQLWKYTVAEGKLQRGVQNVTLKKSLPAIRSGITHPTKTTHTTHTPSGTSNSGNTYAKSATLKNAEQALMNRLNMLPGWYDCIVCDFKPNRGNSGLGQLTLMLNQPPWNDVTLFAVEQPIGLDEVQANIAALWLTSFDNDKAKSDGELRLTSTSWREQPKKNLPVVVNQDGEIEDDEEEFNRLALEDQPDLIEEQEPLATEGECYACGEVKHIKHLCLLNDGDLCCSQCYGNSASVQALCHRIGINKDFGTINHGVQR